MRCGPPGGRSNQRSRAAAIVSRLARYNRLAAASRQALAPRGRPTPWRFSGGAQRRPLQVMGWTPRFSGYVDHVQSWVDIITEGGDLMSTTIAVDLAKSVFEVAVSDTPGRVRIRRRLTRAQFARFVTTQPPATVLLEACGSAHYWGRHAHAAGHDVRLLPPPAVRPYVPRNKTDRADAKGLLEAARNEAIHAVPTGAASRVVAGARSDRPRSLNFGRLWRLLPSSSASTGRTGRKCSTATSSTRSARGSR
jgi:hypothetical protein